ncbi:MAG TPA: dihydroxyacetone kinase subunit DhaK [Terrimicrobiaceae bacterium]
MRKFLVTPDQAVESALEGVLAVSRSPLERVEGHFGLLYRGNQNRKVWIVVGGGSGHEPLFLGAVGPGMADAAIAGAVFAAPNPMSIQATAEALGQADGVICLYGNYSGDVLNFDFAAEELESAGARVAQIRVHDDIASAPPERTAARRGTAGDIYVLKCTAAAADRGLPFDEVVRLGEDVNAQVRSLGVALGAASSIETGEPMFDLPLGSLEIGMGLHGEIGVSRTDFESAESLVPKMIDRLLADYQATATPLDRVAVMVNALGGTTVLELLAVAGHVRRNLEGKGIKIARFEAGEFATSLDMAGFSITMLPLDEERETLLNAGCDSLCYSRAS